MNPEIKQKWLAALRSGEYKQILYCLEQIDGEGRTVGNCCLGVLCRVMEITPIIHHSYYSYLLFDNKETSLSPEILAKAELSIPEQEELTEMNDYRRSSFLEIADYIEANL